MRARKLRNIHLISNILLKVLRSELLGLLKLNLDKLEGRNYIAFNKRGWFTKVKKYF